MYIQIHIDTVLFFMEISIIYDVVYTLHIVTVMCPFRALQQVVEKCGKVFEPHLTSDLVQLVFTCLSHQPLHQRDWLQSYSHHYHHVLVNSHMWCRHYMAERLYCQETWKLVSEMKGA